MLIDVVHRRHPFPHFRCREALPSTLLATLSPLFDREAGWSMRDEAFYACSLRDCTGEVPEAALGELTGRMRELLDIPLADRVAVTTQRMTAGQRVGVHSDRPLLGYEVARLVVFLNDRWVPEDGGVLELFDASDGAPVDRLEPHQNAGFGFVLHDGSHHGVSEVTSERRSVVFNFWHPGNAPDLRDAVDACFEGVHFSELPSALDPVATTAEETLAEEDTHRASLAAWALWRWGHQDDTVIAGYRLSAGLSTGASSEHEGDVLLADWIARLVDGEFDPVAWADLRGRLATSQTSSRAGELLELCFPSTANLTP